MKFKQQAVFYSAERCKCEKCGKEYDREKQLNWIRVPSEWHFIFCDDCYAKVINLIDEWVDRDDKQ